MQLNEEFLKEIELDKMRTELASNMSLAETMDKFQQLEDEVQAVRDQLKVGCNFDFEFGVGLGRKR